MTKGAGFKPFYTIFLFYLVCSGLLLAAPSQTETAAGTFELIFNLLELPFLVLCVVFSFLTANALRGGRFGEGMSLLAWGFLVMAVGHLHMQVNHLFGLNIFNSLLGSPWGHYLWVCALLITWTLSGLGFYKIYKASIGE